MQSLGIANAKDVVKMLRWNDKYGIRFMRLSSEMFPFASHEEYGGRLGEFAGDVLGEVGKVVMELGHRVTVHPGQVGDLSIRVLSLNLANVISSSLNWVRQGRLSRQTPCATLSTTPRCSRY